MRLCSDAVLIYHTVRFGRAGSAVHQRGQAHQGLGTKFIIIFSLSLCLSSLAMSANREQITSRFVTECMYFLFNDILIYGTATVLLFHTRRPQQGQYQLQGLESIPLSL
jgi:hypothetical protein